MRKIVLMISLFCFMCLVSGCDETQPSNAWIIEEMAGIENPGFTIISKNKTKNEVSFVLADVDITMVNEFLEDLYNHPQFTVNVQYNYDTESYSYAAYNNQNESIHFTYDPADKSGYFIYAKLGDALFKPGIRDMGYSVFAEYDYMSNIDYTQYNASVFYSIGLNIKFTNSSEQMISFVLKDFQFKSTSTVGSLSFRQSTYGDPIENYTKSGFSMYDMHFYVVQRNIGQYPVSTPYGHTSTFFDLMNVTQSQLNFVVAFQADVVTTSGSYTYNYEIQVMPQGGDVTEMDRYMTYEHYTKTIDQGKPFTKVE